MVRCRQKPSTFTISHLSCFCCSFFQEIWFISPRHPNQQSSLDVDVRRLPITHCRTLNMPWLFYGDNTDNINLRYSTIPTSYRAGDILNLTAQVYSLDGNYQGTIDAGDSSAPVLSLCPFDRQEMRAILQFGSKVSRRVSVQNSSCMLPQTVWLLNFGHAAGSLLTANVFFQCTVSVDSLYDDPEHETTFYDVCILCKTVN